MTNMTHDELTIAINDFLAKQPLVVSFGAGVDSTAVLVGLHNRGIVPDAIVFADTGAEKHSTYLHIIRMQAWLESVGFPSITIVRYVPPRAPYKDLEGNCTKNETLPSLAFGHHSCSLKWKVEPQHRYLRSWAPAVDAWNRGETVVKAIGYDNSPADQKRAKKTFAIGGGKDAGKYTYWYPLQDWGWDRTECIKQIVAAGAPVPPKSSCYFCPAMKHDEILELSETHPDLFARALEMERIARDGRHGLQTVKGLGRNFAWADLDLAALAAKRDAAAMEA